MLTHFNRENCSKVKESKTFKDKIYMSMLEDVTRDKTLITYVTRECCDEDNEYKFLCLLKKIDGIK